MKKLLFILLLLIMFLFSQQQPCITCEQVKKLNTSKMIIITDEPNFILNIYVFNPQTKAPFANTPILIFIYNDTFGAFEKTFTNASGVALYNFSKYKDNCYNYKIMFCSCENEKLVDCCIKMNGFVVEDNNITIGEKKVPAPQNYDAVPNADGVETPANPVYNVNAFPVTDAYYYCKPPKKESVPAFCLPLTIIFALLGAALMLSGKNPLRGFDISGARIGKHIKYEARGRGAGYSLTSALFTGAAIGRATSSQEAKTFGEAWETQVKKPLEVAKARGVTVTTTMKKAYEFGRGEKSGRVGMVKGVRNVLWEQIKQVPQMIKEAAVQSTERIVSTLTFGMSITSVGAGAGSGRVVAGAEKTSFAAKAGAAVRKAFDRLFKTLGIPPQTAAQVAAHYQLMINAEQKYKTLDEKTMMNMRDKKGNQVLIEVVPKSSSNEQDVEGYGHVKKITNGFIVSKDGKEYVITASNSEFAHLSVAFDSASKDKANEVGGIQITKDNITYFVTQQDGKPVIYTMDGNVVKDKKIPQDIQQDILGIVNQIPVKIGATIKSIETMHDGSTVIVSEKGNVGSVVVIRDVVVGADVETKTPKIERTIVGKTEFSADQSVTVGTKADDGKIVVEIKQNDGTIKNYIIDQNTVGGNIQSSNEKILINKPVEKITLADIVDAQRNFEFYSQQWRDTVKEAANVIDIPKGEKERVVTENQYDYYNTKKNEITQSLERKELQAASKELITAIEEYTKQQLEYEKLKESGKLSSQAEQVYETELKKYSDRIDTLTKKHITVIENTEKQIKDLNAKLSKEISRQEYEEINSNIEKLEKTVQEYKSVMDLADAQKLPVIDKQIETIKKELPPPGTKAYETQKEELGKLADLKTQRDKIINKLYENTEQYLISQGKIDKLPVESQIKYYTTNRPDIFAKAFENLVVNHPGENPYTLIKNNPKLLEDEIKKTNQKLLEDEIKKTIGITPPPTSGSKTPDNQKESK